MTSSLPPDPFEALGVPKTATISDIRSAYRKLVIKCHPDKVQEPALKAVKADEFHRVQQAYELLVDEEKRTEYNSQLRLFKLREEMAKMSTGPSSQSRSTSQAYDVRDAAPRRDTFKSDFREEVHNVYSARTPPSSYEDDVGRHSPMDGPRMGARKGHSYEESPRPRRAQSPPPRKSSRDSKANKDEEKRRDKKAMEALEKEREKSERERRREKESKVRASDRKSKDEKYSRSSKPHVIELSTDEEEYSGKARRKAERRESERAEEARLDSERAERRRRKKDAELEAQATHERARKLKSLASNAAAYMMAAKSKSTRKSREVIDDDIRPRGLRRSATEAVPSPTFTAKHDGGYDSDDYARKGTARSTHRASEQMPESPKSRDRERYRDVDRSLPTRLSRERSGTYDSVKPNIVEAEGPPIRPGMPQYSSSPANLEGMLPREKTRRSRTSPALSGYPPAPGIARASTFTAGDSSRNPRGSSSRLARQYMGDSEDDQEHPTYAPRSESPQPLPRRPQPQTARQTSYRANAKDGVKGYTSRARDDDYDDYNHDRESTPRRATDIRPSLVHRNESRHASSGRLPKYYDEELLSRDLPRPKLSRDSSSSRSRDLFSEPLYATHSPPSYSPEGLSRSRNAGNDYGERANSYSYVPSQSIRA